ncbi:MAG: hypothetical protein HOQ05_07560 [Corynebacteriales bacterium]|nr:hypothetical protein [Mycobacteriales bacterium]
MNTTTKVGAYALGLAVLFGAAFTIGGLVGPVDDDDSGAGHHDAATSPSKVTQPAGLAVSEAGYTLRPLQAPAAPAVESALRFQVIDTDGNAVTSFDTAHDKKLHLIVVRRDLAHYQHLHPTMETDGTWTISLAVPEAGQYRMFADFQPSEHEKGLTLGADFAVNGDYSARALPQVASSSSVDGYDVALSGSLNAGKTSKLTLEVSKDGKPITDLEPYLGAYGHLVALRDGDAAYLHVHPDGEPGDGKTKAGPSIVFYAEIPSAGKYRLYLDFKHGGTVRTVEFTVEASLAKTVESEDDHEGGHGGH